MKFTVRVGDDMNLDPIIIGLFDEVVPETTENFATICQPGTQIGDKLVSYSGSIFHRVIP